MQSRRSASGERLPALLGGHGHLGEKASRDNGENGTVVVKAAENAVEVCVVDLRWAEGIAGDQPDVKVQRVRLEKGKKEDRDGKEVKPRTCARSHLTPPWKNWSRSAMLPRRSSRTK